MKKSGIILTVIVLTISSILSSCKVTDTKCPAYSQSDTETSTKKV
jgi:hypothetical protein